MKKRIMIVDDDPQLREMYTAALEMQGYEVVINPDGEKALAALVSDKAKPDLVLLDVMMPRIHGLDVLNTIKADPAIKDIKVIMLSAVSDEAIKQKAEKYGALSYLVKSELSMSEVLERIREAINS
jgi:DNA-binding response OmpR family regulator